MNKRQDLPLKNDVAARFVPKIVALMVYVGTLCFVFTLFMTHTARVWETQFATQLSIEIPTFSDNASNAVQERVVQLLNKTPGVQHVTSVPQKEMENLFHSLLGEDANLELLPLPVVIDVTLDSKENVDTQNLDIHLKNISPYIQMVDHRVWQSHVTSLIHTGVFLALIITLLILSAALATTTFAIRTSLLIHRQIIEVLSLIGATHSYIATQFQINVFKQGLIASSIGSFIAFLTFLGIKTLLEKSGFSFITTPSFFFQSICVFILAPFFTALSMMLAARLAVMKALRS